MAVTPGNPLGAYLPIDRYHALARGEALPERTHGAALFADISGYTPLMEGLVRSLGPRRGVEELTHHLDRVYAGLIGTVHEHGGSVLGFSGDAITCWFDGDDGARATASAVAMHGTMAQFGAVPLPSGGMVTLALKAAVASGPARRFVVGDPAHLLFDVVVGETVDRMAVAEHLARRAEVVVSPECYAALDDRALVLEWRVAHDGSPTLRYPVIGGLLTRVPPRPWPALHGDAVPDEVLRPWVLPALYTQHREGRGEPAPDLRPAVALFLRFGGIHFAGDVKAGAQLDTYIRWAQGVIADYGGTLLQLTIGEKGSYLYAPFGAPVVHEDDARRAVAAALALHTPPRTLAFVGPVQIGISQGTMRAGAAGAPARRTYAVLGDEVNLAARLMQHARPGETIVGERVARAVAAAFDLEALPAIVVKGKRQPVPVARLIGARAPALGPGEYAGAFVGRADELARLQGFLRPLASGRCAGRVEVYGEAGLGKSRLLAELRARLRDGPPLRWLTLAGDALLRQPLHPVRACLHGYFDQVAGGPEADNRGRFDAVIDTALAAALVRDDPDLALELDAGRSFLGALVDLHWPRSPYERAEPHERRTGILASFGALLRAESLRQPVVLHVDDAHWLDDDSRALLGTLTGNGQAYPFAVLLASRYADDGAYPDFPVAPDTPTARVDLSVLTAESVRALAAQVLGADIGTALADFLVEKTGGNPFFVEQLAQDLRERGGLVRGADGRLMADGAVVAEVPSEIVAVLVARLDRLGPPLKALVQAAAVLGQEFDARILARLVADHPELAALLDKGTHQGLWWPVSEARYRFRHALLRDAAYDMQLSSRLRALHGRAGAAIEAAHAEALAAHVPSLVYHYARAEDRERERHFLALQGEQSYSISAFGEALACFERALALVPDGNAAGRGRALRRLARTLLRLGRDDEAVEGYQESLASAERAGDCGGAAETRYELGSLAYRRADYLAAADHLERGLGLYRAAGDRLGEARVLDLLGGLYIELGEAEKALEYYERALEAGRA
jgi:class 3 adenylate cyclase/tetratricopeptide (TPR) repeat protein